MADGDQLLDVPSSSAGVVPPRPIRRGAHVRGLVADLEASVAKYARGCHCSRLTAARRALKIAQALADRIKATSHHAEPTRRELTHQPTDPEMVTMNLILATAIAERMKAELAPHCERIEIAGSIRRRKPEVGDIEIVAIPKPYDVGLFASGVALVLDRLPVVRGHLPCKATQRLLPEGIALDVFFATRENWGLIFAIRTGSAEFSHRVLAHGWACRGYESREGMLHDHVGRAIATPEEEDVFRIAGVSRVPPEARNL